MTLLAEHQGAHAVATGPKGSVSRSSEGIAGTQRFIEKVANTQMGNALGLELARFRKRMRFQDARTMGLLAKAIANS